MNDLKLALAGRVDLLQAIFGKSDTDKTKGRKSKGSIGARLRAMFSRHNAAWGKDAGG